MLASSCPSLGLVLEAGQHETQEWVLGPEADGALQGFACRWQVADGQLALGSPKQQWGVATLLSLEAHEVVGAVARPASHQLQDSPVPVEGGDRFRVRACEKGCFALSEKVLLVDGAAGAILLSVETR